MRAGEDDGVEIATARLEHEGLHLVCNRPNADFFAAQLRFGDGHEAVRTVSQQSLPGCKFVLELVDIGLPHGRFRAKQSECAGAG